MEKLLAQYGWGRWKAMREASDLKESVSEADIEHISRYFVHFYATNCLLRNFLCMDLVEGGRGLGRGICHNSFLSGIGMEWKGSEEDSLQ